MDQGLPTRSRVIYRKWHHWEVASQVVSSRRCLIEAPLSGGLSNRIHSIVPSTPQDYLQVGVGWIPKLWSADLSSPPSRDTLITSIDYTTAIDPAAPVFVCLLCCHDYRPRLTMLRVSHWSYQVLELYMVNPSYLFHLNIVVIYRYIENLIIDVFNYLYIDKWNYL